MNGAANGNTPPVSVSDDPMLNEPIVASFQVQKKLEQCFRWFLAVGDVNSASRVLPVITSLMDDRSALLDSLYQSAQEAQAAAMIGGG